MTSSKYLNNLGLVTLILSASSVIFSQPLLAQSKFTTYRVNHSYSGVHRCGSREANMREARIAADRQVQKLRSQSNGAINYRLNDFSYTHGTRHWEDTNSLGISKGRKCQTSMEVTVIVESKPADW